MPPNDETGEKTEEATPRQRERAREEGRVASSREVGTLFILTAATVALYFTGPYMTRRLMGLFIGVFQNLSTIDLSMGGTAKLMQDMFIQILLVIGPFMLALVVASLFGWIIQVGFLFVAKPLQPQFSRLNPIEGAKRIFSTQILAETAKSIGKVVIVAAIAYVVYRPVIPLAAAMISRDPDLIIPTMLELGMKLAFFLILFISAIAIFDYSFQRWKHSKDLRMSRYEVKQELKEQEGDPQIRARVRSIRQQQLRQQMMAEVPKAEVVITNPTHYAIAIRYDTGERDAPHVLARGRGVLAQRIKEIAAENDVPMYEDRWLARQLYDACDVGDNVPMDLWTAVAKVLAFVRTMNEKKQAAVGV